jgi:hypothetical protein
MPNWCNNELRADGEKKDIQALQEYLLKGNNELDFTLILPPPDNESDAEWYISKWGTKWEPECIWANWFDDNVCFEFETAWSPPVGIVQALASKFPMLKWELYYDEEGLNFSGLMIWENGNKTLEKSGAYGEDYDEEN